MKKASYLFSIIFIMIIGILFISCKDKTFENLEFDCPKNYKKYLEETYGDYMTLPDEKDRIGHGETYLCSRRSRS